MRLSHVEAAVLAGGQSARMGSDKALLSWRGRPLLLHVVERLAEVVARVRVVTRPDALLPDGLERIEDRLAPRAPLVGIHAALAACDSCAVLIVGCDMPLISPRLLLGLLALVPVDPREGPQIVAPLGSAGPEPLLAVYRRSLLGEVERRISHDQLSLQALLRESDTLFVPESDLRAFDPTLASLRNLNRPEDLAALESEIAADRGQ